MEPGLRIGSYVVREVLGQGGMGTVYLAEHSVIGRKVAIKVLKRDLAVHEGLVARFVNEARAKAVVGHPGIVDVFDYGTLPSGVPYLVMELLEGESLAMRIARVGKLPVKEAAGIAWETASAVGAAHAKGIIHRDLKPENLFLARDAGSPDVEKVKVLDFGIAKLHSSPSKLSTQGGAVMGTPVYMSPEQCRGARDEVDVRTDIYSLGVILYEMLCGKPPFEGEAFGDLLLRHMTEEVVPPSHRNPDVPPSLDDAVLRALAKRREERFWSMREFQGALSAASERSDDKTPLPIELRRNFPGTLTPPLSALTPPRGHRTRTRRAWIGGGAVVGALILGGTFALTTQRRTPAPPRPVSFSASRLEPLPATPVGPPDAGTTATAPPVEVKAPAAVRAPAPGPGKKRPQRSKIDVKQW
jgi:serine/threonine protein kinase